MIYYALQVHTGREKIFIDEMKTQLPESGPEYQFIYLQRKMLIRKQGSTRDKLLPLFPGYLFLESDDKIDLEARSIMRKSDSFYRFLKSNQNITPLDDHDLKLLKHFMDFGKTAGTSQVYFDKDQHIVVISGPLKGLEGFIIKTDKRKHRAKIQIDFENSPMTIDLSFEMISGAEIQV
jgi:transcription termination/antitermination protein NusG